jgi:hypothetical protein
MHLHLTIKSPSPHKTTSRAEFPYMIAPSRCISTKTLFWTLASDSEGDPLSRSLFSASHSCTPMPPPAEFTLFGLSPLMPSSQGGHTSIPSTPTHCHRTPEPFGMPPHIPPAPVSVPEPILQPPTINMAVLLAQLQQLAATMQALQHQNAALQDQLDTQAVAAALPPHPSPSLCSGD